MYVTTIEVHPMECDTETPAVGIIWLHACIGHGAQPVHGAPVALRCGCPMLNMLSGAATCHPAHHMLKS